MTGRRSLNVLFCVAAGPRLGFGHLVRCRVLADALDASPRVWLRGTRSTHAAARAMGWRQRATPDVSRSRFDLMVIDDPSADQVTRHVRRAGRAGIPWASINSPAFRGARWAVLSPDVLRHRARLARRQHDTVVIALGGGSAVRVVGPRVAAGIRRLVPGVRVQLAAGFGSARGLPELPTGCSWLSAVHGLAGAFATASVAVVAGGITAYEACALRTPAVGLAVVPAQRGTLRVLSGAGALRDASHSSLDRSIARAARHVAALVESPPAAGRLARRAGAVVDGQGTNRMARHLRVLAGWTAEENVHAA